MKDQYGKPLKRDFAPKKKSAVKKDQVKKELDEFIKNIQDAPIVDLTGEPDK